MELDEGYSPAEEHQFSNIRDQFQDSRSRDSVEARDEREHSIVEGDDHEKMDLDGREDRNGMGAGGYVSNELNSGGGALGADVQIETQGVTTEDRVQSDQVLSGGSRKRGRNANRSDEEDEEEENDRKSAKKRFTSAKGKGKGKGKGKQVAEDEEEWEELDEEEAEDDDYDEYEPRSAQASSSRGTRSSRAAGRANKKEEEDFETTGRRDTFGNNNTKLIAIARASEEVFDLLVATVRQYDIARQEHCPPLDDSESLVNKQPFVQLYKDWHIPTGTKWENLVSKAKEEGFVADDLKRRIDLVYDVRKLVSLLVWTLSAKSPPSFLRCQYIKRDCLDINRIKEWASKDQSEIQLQKYEEQRRTTEIQIPEYLDLSKKVNRHSSPDHLEA
jgi:hypothetical protein